MSHTLKIKLATFELKLSYKKSLCGISLKIISHYSSKKENGIYELEETKYFLQKFFLSAMQSFWQYDIITLLPHRHVALDCNSTSFDAFQNV